VTAEPQPNRKKPRDQDYRLRIASVTYLGDDAAAARAILEFLRLSRQRQAERELKQKQSIDETSRE
jgi:hypothetical protein